MKQDMWRSLVLGFSQELFCFMAHNGSRTCGTCGTCGAWRCVSSGRPASTVWSFWKKTMRASPWGSTRLDMARWTPRMFTTKFRLWVGYEHLRVLDDVKSDLKCDLRQQLTWDGRKLIAEPALCDVFPGGSPSRTWTWQYRITGTRTLSTFLIHLCFFCISAVGHFTHHCWFGIPNLSGSDRFGLVRFDLCISVAPNSGLREVELSCRWWWRSDSASADFQIQFQTTNIN